MAKFILEFDNTTIGYSPITHASGIFTIAFGGTAGTFAEWNVTNLQTVNNTDIGPTLATQEGQIFRIELDDPTNLGQTGNYPATFAFNVGGQDYYLPFQYVQDDQVAPSPEGVDCTYTAVLNVPIVGELDELLITCTLNNDATIEATLPVADQNEIDQSIIAWNALLQSTIGSGASTTTVQIDVPNGLLIFTNSFVANGGGFPISLSYDFTPEDIVSAYVRECVGEITNKIYSIDSCGGVMSLHFPKCIDLEIGNGMSLPPSTTVEWMIEDMFGNRFKKQVFTDANGLFTIALTDLPEGLLVKGNAYLLRIFNIDGTQVSWTIGGDTFSSATIEIYN